MISIETYIESLPHAEAERLRYLRRDLSQCVPPGGTFRFLDMGAGSGTMSVGALLLFTQARGTLVDIQDRWALPEEVVASLAGRYRLIAWDDLAAIDAETFDLVISTDVLEHIPDWETAFRDLCRRVAAGGYLYVQAPSRYPSPTYPTPAVITQRVLGFFGKNNPNLHLRHGLTCKQLFDAATAMGLTALVAAEDYVVDGTVYCDFKPRCHCLFQKAA